MNSTRKMMKKLITKETQKMSFDALAGHYQRTLNPTYLATAFENLFEMIYVLKSKYRNITEDEASSCAVEQLDICLRNFNFTNKFSTYFYLCYENKLIDKNNLVINRNRVNENSIKINSITSHYSDYTNKTFELINSIKTSDLQLNEKKYLILLLIGFNRKEISKILKLKIITIDKMRKRMQKPQVYNLLKQ